MSGACIPPAIVLLVVAFTPNIQGSFPLIDKLAIDIRDPGSGDGEMGEESSTPSELTLSATPQTPGTCPPEFAEEVDHTMCLEDDPRVTASGVTKQQKQIIVDYHNKVRREVQPPASDLTQMVWDDNLAMVAQKLANQCKMEHDENRAIPWYGIGIGQNLAAGYRTWTQAMRGWYDEVKLYKYGEDADQYLGPGLWTQIGHYTQMVQNQTHRVGCGFAKCSRTRYGRFFACNYAGPQTSWRYPYTLDERCASCPNSCNNGICDCGGKLCMNQGKLDINSCSCTCPDIFSGEDCSQLNCPKSDPSFCRRSFSLADCEIYMNVPHLCPHLCGLCSDRPPNGNKSKGKQTATTTTTTTTPAPTFVSPHNCTFTGHRPSPEECATYGDGGADKWVCQTNGGDIGCEDCDRYANVKTEYCPIMCGLCDAPCGGKVCMNSGLLDTSTCECQCLGPYQGSTCNQLECPAHDAPFCKFYAFTYCSAYLNVPAECPHLCGICT